MRIAYLDCFSGISGDMFLGALIDAGVSPKLLENTGAALNIGARLEISRVVRGGISASKVDVYANGEKDLPREVFWEQREHGHAHEHGKEHDHRHDDEIGGSCGSAPPPTGKSPVSTKQPNHQPSGGLTEIRHIMKKEPIGRNAKRTASTT